MEKIYNQYDLTQYVSLNGDKDTYTQRVDVTEIVRRDRYLTYKEALDEYNINVVLRLGDDYAKIQRRGIINMNFYFVEGVTTDTFYESPAGKHHYQLETSWLDIKEDEIYIEYTLYTGGEVLGEYKYQMKKAG